MQIEITHTIDLPDPRRMELYRRNPDLGPRTLFFSGGSALRKASEELVYYSHNSIHIITPVDSGGSSAVLRNAFEMPAIGDIRDRLMALADRGLTGNPEIFRLFAYRLPPDADQEALEEELTRMAQGAHPLIQRVPDPMRKVIRNFLQFFVDMVSSARMPDGFNPRSKVFIPNTGKDPELFGHSLSDQVETLLQVLKRDDRARIDDADVLNYILLKISSGSESGSGELPPAA